MKLLNHLESDSINSMRIKNVSEIWMKRIGSTKDSGLEEKVVVHLVFIIFCLTRGDVNEAHQAALSLMQEREFGRHPMSNVVVALTFCERWYSSIPKASGKIQARLTPLSNLIFRSEIEPPWWILRGF